MRGKQLKDIAKKIRYGNEIRELTEDDQIILIDMIGDTSRCGIKCKEHIDKWMEWITDHFGGILERHHLEYLFNDRPDLLAKLKDHIVPATPLAMIAIPGGHEEYLKFIGPKSRNMIRKVERLGYSCSIFTWNDFLDDVYAINTSKEKRGGKEMSASYKAYPGPVSIEPEHYCEQHQIVFYGCFKDGHLYAYCQINFVNDLAVINQILGHGEALKDGIMNGLINCIVEDCIAHRKAKYLNYLTLHSTTANLDGFKNRVGFRPYVTCVKKPEVVGCADKSTNSDKGFFRRCYDRVLGKIYRLAVLSSLLEVLIEKGKKVRHAKGAPLSLARGRAMNSSFPMKGYEEYLRRALDKGVRFCLFGDYEEAARKNVNYHFLKHDIHHDMKRTFEMARLERDLGIRATYFMLHRHPCNRSFFDSPETWQTLRDIQAMGHEIALHCDGFVLIEKYGDLHRAITEELSKFTEERIGIRGGNTHGNTRYWNLLRFEPMSFYREVCRPNECTNKKWNVHYGRYSLKELGFQFWADTTVWTGDKEQALACYVTDNSMAWKMCSLAPGATGWLLEGGRFDLDPAFLDQVIGQVFDKSCSYLIHPQFYS